MSILLEEAGKAVRQGEKAVLVTIVSAHGSVPRGAGAQMLVRSDGTCMGTIGGGAVEYRAGLEAMNAMREERSFLKSYDLSSSRAAELGMVCGGGVQIYFQYISPGNEIFLWLCIQAETAFQKGEDCWLILDFTQEDDWTAGICRQSGNGENQDRTWRIQWPFEKREQREMEVPSLSKAEAVTVEGRNYFFQPLVRSGRVYIFGGGHVARELVPVLARVEFSCVVFDDREEFSRPEQFPQAVETITGDFQDIFKTVSIREQDYVIIMTRGHEFDYEVQRQALETPAHYIGVMGSRAKLARQEERLRTLGFSSQDMARFSAPIGVPISAQTPAEIAVSIGAQLIMVRAKREGREKK